METSRRYLALLLTLMILTACGPSLPTGTADKAGPIRIGVITPLTGAWATGGEGVSRGITLAAEEINANGGVGGRKIELVIEDSRSDVKDGVTAAQKLFANDDISAVIGGVISGEAAAQAPVAQESHKVLLSASATTSSIETAGEWVFKLRESTKTHADATAAEIKKRGHPTISIIYQDSETCKDFVMNLKNSLENAGIKAIAEERYSPSDKDMRSQLSKLAESGADSLFECGLYEDIGQVLKQARELGLDKPAFTIVAAESKKLFEIAGDSAEGIIFTSSKFSCEDSKDFCSRFNARFRNDPDYRPAFGYDAMMLVAEAIKRKGDSPEQIKNGLLSIQGYTGVTGGTSFDHDGNAQKEVIVKQVNGGKFITIPSAGDTGDQSKKPIGAVIGVSTLLSGDFASLGQNMLDSAILALDEIPHKGLDIKLAAEGANCGSGQGLTAVKKLVEVDGAQAVIGGTCSDDTMAAAPYVNENRIVYLTPVTGGSNVDGAGEYVFRIGNSDVLAGENPATDLIVRFNVTSAATVTEQREYTIDIRDNFKRKYASLGGKLVVDEVFEPDSRDFRTMILKIIDSRAGAVLLSSQLGVTGGTFIKQAREAGLDVPIITTFTTVTNPDAKKIAGESMEGVYFYDPSYDTENPELERFLEKYKSRYRHDPAVPFHTAATYDSMKLAIDAMQAVGNDGAKMHDWMMKNSAGRTGFMGDLALDARGNTNIGFTLKRMEGDRFVTVNKT
ncbi:MAG: ABC transporter substrate-binding protein [Nanoarchaeota archaeon]